MNKNGARRKNARRAHMHEALWLCAVVAPKKRDAAPAADQWPTYRVGGGGDAVATPKSRVFGPATQRLKDLCHVYIHNKHLAHDTLYK